MPVPLDVVATISGAVAAEHPPVERITIASTNAGAHRVELLVILRPYPFEPRRLLLNLSRKDPAAFERQLRAKLNEIHPPFRPALSQT